MGNKKGYGIINKCPICGMFDFIHISYDKSDGNPFVECEECMIYVYGETVDNAIKKWNELGGNSDK